MHIVSMEKISLRDIFTLPHTGHLFKGTIYLQQISSFASRSPWGYHSSNTVPSLTCGHLNSSGVYTGLNFYFKACVSFRLFSCMLFSCITLPTLSVLPVSVLIGFSVFFLHSVQGLIPFQGPFSKTGHLFVPA